MILAHRALKIFICSTKQVVSLMLPYPGYLTMLVDEYNSNYHSIGKEPIHALTEEIGMNPKSSTFKVGGRVRIIKYNNIFSKGCTENWSRETFVTDSVLKTNPWTNRIKVCVLFFYQIFIFHQIIALQKL